MTDSNKTRSRIAANKRAFDEILGGSDLDGYYTVLKYRSFPAATKTNFDEGRGTSNPARPSTTDFCCDVELILSNVIEDKQDLTDFILFYINGDITEQVSQFPQVERSRLEQRIGRMFLSYGISPAAKYFTTIRQPRKG